MGEKIKFLTALVLTTASASVTACVTADRPAIIATADPRTIPPSLGAGETPRPPLSESPADRNLAFAKALEQRLGITPQTSRQDLRNIAVRLTYDDLTWMKDGNLGTVYSDSQQPRIVQMDRSGQVFFAGIQSPEVVFPEPNPVNTLEIKNGPHQLIIRGTLVTIGNLKPEQAAFQEFFQSFTEGFKTPVSLYFIFNPTQRAGYLVGTQTIGNRAEKIMLPAGNNATTIALETQTRKTGDPSQLSHIHIILGLDTIKSDALGLGFSLPTDLLDTLGNEHGNALAADANPTYRRGNDGFSSAFGLAVARDPDLAVRLFGTSYPRVLAVLSKEMTRLGTVK